MTEKISLYSGAEEVQQIEALLEHSQVDLSSPEQVESLAKRSNDLMVLLQEKTDSVSKFQRHLDNEIKECEYVIKEYTAHKKRLERKQDDFEKYILRCMDMLGVKKIIGKIYTISYRQPTKIVSVVDQNKLDMEFLRTTTPEPVTEVDKRAIKYAIESGRTIDGVELIDGKRSLSFTAGK
jgi:hypothetical protein